MDCDVYMLSCQLSELVRVASEGPSLFEWAQLISSVAVGVATLIVAIVALRISMRANQLALTLQEQADHANRRAVARALRRAVRNRLYSFLESSGRTVWLEGIEETKGVSEALRGTADGVTDEICDWIDREFVSLDRSIGVLEAERITEQLSEILDTWVREPVRTSQKIRSVKASVWAPDTYE
ncbi:hypothetical protein SCB71_14595 [Herbiconiux sp. KACC 21604]|uniref:hypothetical protein n=1 Tax=unclassified Herbiconiux TaxID=2618217 RepID=UPI001492966E|nr:hypothetical protein [Herbiconiux sp. SALV-R1]QJU54371.1 hypothetical protein HL652_12535 [Herbiconiux sp. SALV-R1]WPO85442.1 hypothetical protein SCB71_14595 [Herbiconiux sp. KACC 21604]